MHPFSRGILNLLYPPLCPSCGRRLGRGETCLCTLCQYRLPRLRLESFAENAVSARLAGKIPFEKAAAAFAYQKESLIQSLFESFKYDSNSRLADFLGSMAGRRLSAQNFFDGIDFIVPVPLHPKKQAVRGYNQSLRIAEGLSRQSGIPVETKGLRRVHATETQTRKSAWERQENMWQVFEAVPDVFPPGSHLLLVDDVLTTGATLEACGRALLASGKLRLSIFALALA